MSTYAQAAALAEQGAALMVAAGLDAIGTTSSYVTPDHLLDGRVVLVATPPTVTYPTWDEVDAAWELYLITGPADPANLATAWHRLDVARDALVLPLELERATPTTYDDGQGTRWPALILTTTTHHDRT